MENLTTKCFLSDPGEPVVRLLGLGCQKLQNNVDVTLADAVNNLAPTDEANNWETWLGGQMCNLNTKFSTNSLQCTWRSKR